MSRITNLFIGPDTFNCMECRQSFSRNQGGSLVELCKCKTLRVVRLKDYIEVSNTTEDEMTEINYI